MENTDPNHDRRDAEDVVDEQSSDDQDVSKIDLLNRQLAEKDQELASMRETILRERAEIDNQRKRLQRDVEQARKFANERLLADLLPALDNLERGLSAETTDAAGLRSGVELTQRELVRLAEASGLVAVNPVDQPFDPDLHQAMQMVDGGGRAPGTVVSVFQKGYTLNDRLLRPALVTVTKAAD
ncbi:MAG: nucleotide exchange factor GrpE [Dokdonella sp.]